MTSDPSSSLNSTLNAVAKGKLSAQSAQEWIENHYALKKKDDLSLDSIKNAFERLKKFQESITQNLPPIGFSANIPGIESKLSIFREIKVSADSNVLENQVIGSQCFGVEFSKTAEIKKNKFTASQLTEFSVICSDFVQIHASLVRFSNLTVQESRFEQSKITRSIWSDVSITESDFSKNTVSKSDFSGSVINASRLADLQFNHVTIKDCEFDQCLFEKVDFENCEFKDCVFQNIQLNLKETLKISECKCVGKTIANCKTEEEFLAALNS